MYRVSVRVLPGFFLSLAFGLLLLPISWVFAWLTAALWHEMCHFLALRMTKCPIYAVSFSFGQIRMETENLAGIKMAVCALAGPLGGLLLLLLADIWPQIALCAFIQSLYNLLPVEPLDGEKALRGILAGFWQEDDVSHFLKGIRYLIILFLLIVCTVCTINYGKLPLICFVALFLKIFLANRSGWKYNSPIGYK